MLTTITKIPQVADVTDRYFIAIQALHAMHPCEVMELEWEDMDLEHGVILPSEASSYMMKPTICDTIGDMHF